MSLGFLGWLLAGFLFALLMFSLQRSREKQTLKLDTETEKPGLEDVRAPSEPDKLGDSDESTAGRSVLSRWQSSPWWLGQNLRSAQRALFVTAAIVLVSGIGAAIAYVGVSPETKRLGEAAALSGQDDETAARLSEYVRSVEAEKAPVTAGTGELLPDVNVMIEKLEARLKAAPQDVEGWRMLGWSYFHTERYQQASNAFERALKLDPDSAELKLSYEQARAKASQGKIPEMTSSLQTEPVDGNGAGSGNEKVMPSETMPPGERDAAIRKMVDGLAQRLENSPRDVDGWVHLMRSRVVLGEKEVAVTAYRKALQVFVGDTAATNQISAAASELGLKPE
jgi:cytochrome c-type biogenesis protein CcmH/NrfG